MDIDGFIFKASTDIPTVEYIVSSRSLFKGLHFAVSASIEEAESKEYWYQNLAE